MENKNEEFYRLIAEHSCDLICFIDTSGRFIYCSPSYKTILGYAPEELLGKNVTSIIHPDELQEVEKTLQETLSSKSGKTVEFRWRQSSGDYLTLETSGAWICDSHGEPTKAIAVSRDITERKRLEVQLRAVQKMESVGRLAGGIAHDFNNLLTAILGLSELAIRTLAPNHSARPELEEIKKTGRRAALLVQQLLAYSRKQIIHPKVIDLNEHIRDIERMLKRVVHEDIEFQVMLGKNLWPVLVDSGQIEQVIMNLVVNASDAMPKGGALIIKTENRTLDSSFKRLRPEIIPGDYLLVSIMDTGVGISKEVRPHLFEPFFTTKTRGSGAGLGLATCYGIIKQNNGYIYAESEIGKGATFQVFIPRAKGRAAHLNKPQNLSEDSRGTETILLVEDEPAVRRLANRILSGQGYAVLEAEGGEEAVRFVERDGEKRIRLMLTDVIMPKINGDQLAKQVSKIRPDIKVLFMSGYTDDAIADHGVLAEGTFFLRKPFSPSELGAKIREVLGPSELSS